MADSERWVILATEEDGTQRVFGPSKEQKGRCTYDTALEGLDAADALLPGVETSAVKLEELT